MPVKSPEIIEVLPVVEEPKVQTSIPESPEISKSEIPNTNTTEVGSGVSYPQSKPEAQSPANSIPSIKVSALSLSSIRAKKELELHSKATAKEEVHLPVEEFNETDMLLQWTKFAQRLSDKGHKIMESLLLINDPKLQGTTIIHELPNEGSKIDFETGKYELLGYLRGKLHNHDIDIRVIVNESMDSRKAFTPQDRFNRLNEINPSLELLRKTFDLDI